MTRRSPIALALAAMLPLMSCSHRATQLMVVVETDLDASAYDCVSVQVTRVVGGVATTPTQFRSFVTSTTRLPLSFGVVPPNGDASAFVQVSVEARRGTCDDPNIAPVPAPLVRTAVRASFGSEQTLRLPMFLAASCTSVTCDADAACDPTTGTCATIPMIAGSDLLPVRPGDELSDAGAITSDAGPPHDAGPGNDAASDPDGGIICIVDGEDRPITGTPPFGLTSTRVSGEWAILYSTGTSVRTYRYPFASAFASADTEWAAEGVDAIAVEGVLGSDDLIALVNPVGTTDLIRYAGPATGTGTRSALALAPATLLDGGRHSAPLGNMLVTVITRGAAFEVIGVSATSAMTIDSGTLPADIALGNTATGDLLVALGGAGSGICTIHQFDVAGAPAGTTTLAPMGASSCRPRGLSRLADGRNALLYADGTALYLQVFQAGSSTAATYWGIRRRNMATAIPTAAAILGTSTQFRAVWAETDAVYSQNNFDDVTRIHQFASGGYPASYASTRWEVNGEQSVFIVPMPTGLRFATWFCP